MGGLVETGGVVDIVATRSVAAFQLLHRVLGNVHLVEIPVVVPNT